MGHMLMFGAGLGVGYVLGTRAGRERFNQLSGKAKQVWATKPVQEAAGAVREHAGRLYEGGIQAMSPQGQMSGQGMSGQGMSGQGMSGQGMSGHGNR